jgi:NAD(P)-dependent dehydrogenase (short-subunit alcohol dehydrogenase family)
MDKIALITGAAGGVGRALTERLQSRGWRLALVSRERGRVNELAEVPEALAVHADVSTADGAETAVGETVEHFGRAPDALVNCAGSTLLAPLHRTKLEQYRACLSANLDSAFFSLAAFVRACLESKQPGSAVLVSSVVARIGVSNHEAIAAAKAGVAGLTQAAAASYAGQGIRVNAIAPGILRTPSTERLFSAAQAEKQIAAQYPLGRYGSADDGADAITWLLSDEAGWITGQVLGVDGGFSTVRPMVRA